MNEQPYAPPVPTERELFRPWSWWNLLVPMILPSCLIAGWLLGDWYWAIAKKSWFPGPAPIVESPVFGVIALLGICNVAACIAFFNNNRWGFVLVVLTAILAGFGTWLLFVALSIV